MPSPSCPRKFAPQVQTLPPDSRASEWLHPAASHLALGSGWRYAEQIPGAAELPWERLDADVLPHAIDVAWLGLWAWQRGDVVLPHQLEPTYLRDQVAWRKSE